MAACLPCLMPTDTRRVPPIMSACCLPVHSDKPDYAYLRRLFTDLALRNKIEYDGNFDWLMIPNAYATAGPGSGGAGGMREGGGDDDAGPPSDDDDDGGDMHEPGVCGGGDNLDLAESTAARLERIRLELTSVSKFVSALRTADLERATKMWTLALRAVDEADTTAVWNALRPNAAAELRWTRPDDNAPLIADELWNEYTFSVAAGRALWKVDLAPAPGGYIEGSFAALDSGAPHGASDAAPRAPADSDTDAAATGEEALIGPRASGDGVESAVSGASAADVPPEPAAPVPPPPRRMSAA